MRRDVRFWRRCSHHGGCVNLSGPQTVATTRSGGDLKYDHECGDDE